MSFGKSAIAALLALGTLGSAWAAGPITVHEPWVRASVPGQGNGAGYLQIDNGGAQADTLLSVSSDAAERVELHNVITENGVASMRQVDGVPVPANGSAQLSPGGYHVMFLKLKAPFKQGDEVAATLRFEQAGEVPVRFTVQPPTHNPAGAHGGGHGGGHGQHKH